MFCKKCGNQINPGENFCGKCGERVVNNQANPTPLPNDTSNSVNPTVMPSANDNVNPTLVGMPNVSAVNQESTEVSNSTTLEQKPKNNNVVLFVIIGVLCALIAYFGVNLLFKKINSSGNNKPSTTKIVDKNHYDIGCLGCIGGGHNGQSLTLGLSPALASVIQTDNNIHAAVLQVKSMSVSL